MENKQSSTSLKAVIAVLAVLLVGSLVYIFKLSSDTEKVQTVLTTTVSEKESVLKDLEELKATYDAAIAENTSMSDELIQERDKVVSLMAEVKKSKGDLSAFKTKMNLLQNKLKALMAENEGLKNENTVVKAQRDSTAVVLNESKKFNEALVGQNDELAKVVEKGSKLTVLNIKSSAYKVRSSGKEIETEKARRTNMLKISFTIAGNEIAQSGDKTYYVQVIDSKNNVLGEKKNISFDGKDLTYSFTSTVKYENKTVQVSENLPGKDFQKGTYYVNVFDKGDLVSKSSFELK
ncbi:hypothetical protein B6A10_06555 [Flavobacterium sp. L1I52]|uniref:Chromosome partitioning protein ParA n=1 Tax=Flavobacterium pokkalii TaxID=1940408 RepID=A0ABR7UQZ3_9FLAO|nr:hypothetical protein [Flavobacterium pokkalii]MBD0724836.1 hypothetical protein [Flavobacterium pokkalii]